MPETTKRNQPSGPSKPQPQSTESSDLEEREYVGSDGQIHHHTKKYMEQHPEARTEAAEEEEED